jgi:hypothetical protein
MQHLVKTTGSPSAAMNLLQTTKGDVSAALKLHGQMNPAKAGLMGHLGTATNVGMLGLIGAPLLMGGGGEAPAGGGAPQMAGGPPGGQPGGHAQMPMSMMGGQGGPQMGGFGPPGQNDMAGMGGFSPQMPPGMMGDHHAGMHPGLPGMEAFGSAGMQKRGMNPIPAAGPGLGKSLLKGVGKWAIPGAAIGAGVGAFRSPEEGEDSSWLGRTARGTARGAATSVGALGGATLGTVGGGTLGLLGGALMRRPGLGALAGMLGGAGLGGYHGGRGAYNLAGKVLGSPVAKEASARFPFAKLADADEDAVIKLMKGQKFNTNAAQTKVFDALQHASSGRTSLSPQQAANALDAVGVNTPSWRAVKSKMDFAQGKFLGQTPDQVAWNKLRSADQAAAGARIPAANRPALPPRPLTTIDYAAQQPKTVLQATPAAAPAAAAGMAPGVGVLSPPPFQGSQLVMGPGRQQSPTYRKTFADLGTPGKQTNTMLAVGKPARKTMLMPAGAAPKQPAKAPPKMGGRLAALGAAAGAIPALMSIYNSSKEGGARPFAG